VVAATGARQIDWLVRLPAAHTCAFVLPKMPKRAILVPQPPGIRGMSVKKMCEGGFRSTAIMLSRFSEINGDASILGSRK
jgi:hypothetical protein